MDPRILSYVTFYFVFCFWMHLNTTCIQNIAQIHSVLCKGSWYPWATSCLLHWCVPGQEMSPGDVPFTANERLSGVLSTREHGPFKMLKYRNLRLFWCWPAEKRNKAPSVWTLQTSKFISFAEGCKEPHFPLGPCDCLWQIFNIPLMNGWLIEQEDWNQTLRKHTLSN